MNNMVDDTSAAAHLFNLDYIDDDETKVAYLALLIAAERSGYRTEAAAKGVISGLSFFDGEAQPFSLIPNKRHLLFYLREPALRERPQLRETAAKFFPDTYKAKPNRAVEAHFRIHNLAEAQSVISWLFVTPGYAARRSA